MFLFSPRSPTHFKLNIYILYRNLFSKKGRSSISIQIICIKIKKNKQRMCSARKEKTNKKKPNRSQVMKHTQKSYHRTSTTSRHLNSGFQTDKCSTSLAKTSFQTTDFPINSPSPLCRILPSLIGKVALFHWSASLPKSIFNFN